MSSTHSACGGDRRRRSFRRRRGKIPPAAARATATRGSRRRRRRQYRVEISTPHIGSAVRFGISPRRRTKTPWEVRQKAAAAFAVVPCCKIAPVEEPPSTLAGLRHTIGSISLARLPTDTRWLYCAAGTALKMRRPVARRRRTWDGRSSRRAARHPLPSTRSSTCMRRELPASPERVNDAGPASPEREL